MRTMAAEPGLGACPALPSEKSSIYKGADTENAKTNIYNVEHSDAGLI